MNAIQPQISEADKKKIVQEAETYMKAKRISANQLSHLSNINAGNFSRMRKSDFSSISDVMFERLKEAVKADLGSMRKDWRIINSLSVQTIESVCEQAQQSGRMLAVFGPTGCGKTTGFLTYKRNQPTGVKYLKCNSLMNRKRFLQAICKVFGQDANGTSPTLYNRLIEYLNKGRRRLLILDNIHKLKRDVIELIHEIREDTEEEKGLGIVLSGTERFKDDFTKWREQNKTCFRELYRRIGYWEAVNRPEPHAVKAICKSFGIDTAKATNHVIKHASPDFGTLQEFLTEAHRLSMGQPITLETLQSVR